MQSLIGRTRKLAGLFESSCARTELSWCLPEAFQNQSQNKISEKLSRLAIQLSSAYFAGIGSQKALAEGLT